MERHVEIVWCPMKAEIHPLRVIIKALLLFVAMNIVYALVDPPVHELSMYNFLFPGRVRMPFGDFSDPYVVMIDDVDAMFASHAISRTKDVTEYRVVLIGDSSVWGEGIPADESISEQWNNLNTVCNGQEIKVYNLGYPHPSVIKDLVILDKAVEDDPDLIVWFVTLNTLTPRRLSAFLDANRKRVANMLDLYDIPFEHEEALSANASSFYKKTLIGQRSYLARWIKLQILGVAWAATDADSRIDSSENLDIPSPDTKAHRRYKEMNPTSNLKKMILFDAVTAGYDIANSIPILIVNEPIFISTGLHGDVRYNDIYPRWAYNQYRKAIADEAQYAGWNYLDLWNSISPKYFSDGLFHLTAEGERLLIEQINPALKEIVCK
jgi:hypothetical protein